MKLYGIKITGLIFTAVNMPTSVIHLLLSVFVFCSDPFAAFHSMLAECCVSTDFHLLTRHHVPCSQHYCQDVLVHEVDTSHSDDSNSCQ